MILRLAMLALVCTASLRAVEPAIPAVFIGEWRATIVSAQGDYAQWYRPGDVSDVAISRLGILRTLDGGGGLIHFALLVEADPAGAPRVVADRLLPGSIGIEHVIITVDHDVLRVEVEIPDVGRMELELAQMLPLGIT